MGLCTFLHGTGFTGSGENTPHPEVVGHGDGAEDDGQGDGRAGEELARGVLAEVQ